MICFILYIDEIQIQNIHVYLIKATRVTIFIVSKQKFFYVLFKLVVKSVFVVVMVMVTTIAVLVMMSSFLVIAATPEHGVHLIHDEHAQ